MLLVVVLRNWLVAEYFRKCEQREHSEGSFVTYVMREKERANSELKHLSVLLHRECDEKMLVFTWWCFAVCEQREHSEGSFVSYVMREKDSSGVNPRKFRA